MEKNFFFFILFFFFFFFFCFLPEDIPLPEKNQLFSQRRSFRRQMMSLQMDFRSVSYSESCIFIKVASHRTVSLSHFCMMMLPIARNPRSSLCLISIHSTVFTRVWSSFEEP